jgi:SHS2 domain-containing protein
MTTVRWEHFPHGADVGIRGIGASKAEAFEQAAVAMAAAIIDPSAVMPRLPVDVVCEAPDDELLLFDWLNALVYEMAKRRMLFGKFEVRLDGNKLSGRAWGEKIDVKRHQPAVEVKGATLTSVAVRQEPDGLWVAQCVVDV